jgi:tellurite resistance protein TerA
VTTLTRGANAPLSGSPVTVSLRGVPSGAGDLLAFLVGSDRRVRSDADFVFFNQPTAAGGAVRLSGTQVRIDPAGLPADVETVVVAVSLDDRQPGSLAAFSGLGAQLQEEAAGVVDAPAAGLSSERAAVLVEVYRRGAGWKVRCVSAGWARGLAALAQEHGVEVDEAPPPPPAPAVPPTAPRPAPAAPSWAPAAPDRSPAPLPVAAAVSGPVSVALVSAAPFSPGGFPPPGGEAPPPPQGPFPRLVAGFPPPGT